MLLAGIRQHSPPSATVNVSLDLEAFGRWPLRERPGRHPRTASRSVASCEMMVPRYRRQAASAPRNAREIGWRAGGGRLWPRLSRRRRLATPCRVRGYRCGKRVLVLFNTVRSFSSDFMGQGASYIFARGKPRTCWAATHLASRPADSAADDDLMSLPPPRTLHAYTQSRRLAIAVYVEPSRPWHACKEVWPLGSVAGCAARTLDPAPTRTHS